jgi:hypothetical protein
MISAELAMRVAEAYDQALVIMHPRMAVPFASLGVEQRNLILLFAATLLGQERLKHKASLQALMACVEDAIKEGE